MSDQDRPRVRIHFPPIPDERSKMLVHEWIKMLREGCRRGEPLLGSDAKLLEQVLTGIEQELNDAKAECGRLRNWASKHICDDTPKYSSVSSNCGECVPCKARAALKGNKE